MRHASVGIVMPNFNHGHLIGTAVAALVSQSRPPDEIVIVDDASTDDSRQRLEALAARHPSIRVEALARNVGAIGAMNHGLATTTADRVLFAAADDFLLPGTIEILSRALDAAPDVALACCEAVVRDMETGAMALRPPILPAFSMRILPPAAVARAMAHADNWILTGSALIRTDALRAIGGFDPALGAFADGYVVRRLAFGQGVVFVPHPGHVWQVSDAGLSRGQAADPVRAFGQMDTAIARLRDDAVFPAWYPPVFARRWRFGLARLAIGRTPIDRPFLDRLMTGTRIGRAIVAAACRLPAGAARLLLLAWMTITMRPLSVPRLLATRAFRAATGAPRRAAALVAGSR